MRVLIVGIDVSFVGEFCFGNSVECFVYYVD